MTSLDILLLPSPSWGFGEWGYWKSNPLITRLVSLATGSHLLVLSKSHLINIRATFKLSSLRNFQGFLEAVSQELWKKIKYVWGIYIWLSEWPNIYLLQIPITQSESWTSCYRQLDHRSHIWNLIEWWLHMSQRVLNLSGMQITVWDSEVAALRKRLNVI